MSKGPLDIFGFVEIIVTGAIALALGFWQLWSINRDIAKDKDKAAKDVGFDVDAS